MEKAFRLFSKSLNHKISEKKNNKVSNDDCNPSNNRKIITIYKSTRLGFETSFISQGFFF